LCVRAVGLFERADVGGALRASCGSQPMKKFAGLGITSD